MLNAPWFVLALVVTNAMGLSLSPVFSFSSSPLLRRPFFSLSWFLGEGLSGLSLGGQQQESSRTAAACTKSGRSER